MSYKTTNDLMQHLRDNGIAISGETQKQQLVTTCTETTYLRNTG